jgi:hypothetical protein
MWKMIDADGFRLEAAEQFGFVEIDTDGREGYVCTEAQLIAFAKACERKGRAEAAQLVRREFNNPLNAQAKSPLFAVLGALKKRNDETDAELAPLLEAERQRSLAAKPSDPCTSCEPETAPAASLWRTRENETDFPEADGWYRVMVSGDSESIDGHTIYSFDDYETWAEFKKHEDGGSFVGTHDEEAHTIFAYCGPFVFPAYEAE